MKNDSWAVATRAAELKQRSAPGGLIFSNSSQLTFQASGSANLTHCSGCALSCHNLTIWARAYRNAAAALSLSLAVRPSAGRRPHATR